MRSNFIFLFLVLFILSTNSYLLSSISQRGQTQGIETISKSVNVSVFIGDFGQYRFNLFGYTSPLSLVTIEGSRIYDQTYSDKKGYFVFANRFFPRNTKETCLTSQDQLGRLSQPTCLPPFIPKNGLLIGPVILPPTLSLDKSDYYIDDEVILSGQTIPNSEINLSMFTKDTQVSRKALSSKSQAPNKFESINSKRLEFGLPAGEAGICDLEFICDLVLRISNLSLIRPVEAFTFPQLQSKADNEGNFSVSLPSSKVEKYRLFAQTSYEKNPSDKSNILNLDILPIWMIILKILWLLIQFLKPKFIEIAIIVELVLLLLYIFRRYFQPHIIAKNRTLVLRESLALLQEEKTIILKEQNSLIYEY